jgi:hypothetical protein
MSRTYKDSSWSTPSISSKEQFFQSERGIPRRITNAAEAAGNYGGENQFLFLPFYSPREHLWISADSGECGQLEGPSEGGTFEVLYEKYMADDKGVARVPPRVTTRMVRQKDGQEQAVHERVIELDDVNVNGDMPVDRCALPTGASSLRPLK